jgi:hypothetical protein
MLKKPFPMSLKLSIFSFLNGATIYHKIALINKETRLALPNAGLLDQFKQLKIKSTSNLNNQNLPNIINLYYALEIIDNIDLTFTFTQQSFYGYNSDLQA